jgi:hypothetical protein
MPLTQSISVSQSANAPQYITVTDTSTGSDAAVTQRRIFVQDALGEYLTGDGADIQYDEWPYADSTITLDILEGDLAANILVQWLNSSNVVLYTYNNNYPFSQFGKQFFVYLVQSQGLTPGIYQGTGYSQNMAIFWANLVGGINQVEEGNDIAGAQNCFNRTNNMRENESMFFS